MAWVAGVGGADAAVVLGPVRKREQRARPGPRAVLEGLAAGLAGLGRFAQPSKHLDRKCMIIVSVT